MEVRIIDELHKGDINIPNEPFALFGRMVLGYTDGKWSYTTELFDEHTELPREVAADARAVMRFPDENYDYDAMKSDSIFIGAYDGETCIGLAIMQQAFFKYMYLMDLKVNAAYRGSGAAGMLIEKAKEVARQEGYNGIYTQGQDNNLAACLFYIKSGFRIGGYDTEVYNGTNQEGKADILFYLDCK